MNDFDSIFSVLDAICREAISKENSEEYLINAYEGFFNEVKLKVGTSSGYTGISEYLFFRCIKFMIEEKVQGNLEPFPNTLDTYTFKSNSIVLTHDVFVNSFNNSLPRQKTDIAIFNEVNGTHSLLGAFQIKVYITNDEKLNDELSKLNDLLLNSKAYLFMILFNKQYPNKFESFCNKSTNRAYIISKPNLFNKQSMLSLKSAVDLIINKIS